MRAADFRHNRIRHFKAVREQLPSFRRLCDLALDNNCLVSAVGLSALRSLLHLSVTHNQLRNCDGFDALPVRATSATSGRLPAQQWRR